MLHHFFLIAVFILNLQRILAQNTSCDCHELESLRTAVGKNTDDRKSWNDLLHFIENLQGEGLTEQVVSIVDKRIENIQASRIVPSPTSNDREFEMLKTDLRQEVSTVEMKNRRLQDRISYVVEKLNETQESRMSLQHRISDVETKLKQSQESRMSLQHRISDFETKLNESQESLVSLQHAMLQERKHREAAETEMLNQKSLLLQVVAFLKRSTSSTASNELMNEMSVPLGGSRPRSRSQVRLPSGISFSKE